MLKKRSFLMLFQAIVVSILLITYSNDLESSVDLSFRNVHEQRQKKILSLLFKNYKHIDINA